MRMALMVVAACALLGGAAQAQDNRANPAAGQDADRQDAPTATKVLYVCSEEERNWRAFSRDLGTPDFVTAKKVMADQGKAWSEPKCITQTELRRLNKLAANTLK